MRLIRPHCNKFQPSRSFRVVRDFFVDSVRMTSLLLKNGWFVAILNEAVIICSEIAKALKYLNSFID